GGCRIEPAGDREAGGRDLGRCGAEVAIAKWAIKPQAEVPPKGLRVRRPRQDRQDRQEEGQGEEPVRHRPPFASQEWRREAGSGGEGGENLDGLAAALGGVQVSGRRETRFELLHKSLVWESVVWELEWGGLLIENRRVVRPREPKGSADDKIRLVQSRDHLPIDPTDDRISVLDRGEPIRAARIGCGESQ